MTGAKLTFFFFFFFGFVGRVSWCIRLTRLTLVCEVIRYRLVQVRQNQKKTFRVGGPQSPFSISSSFILSFVLLPFFLNTKMKKKKKKKKKKAKLTTALNSNFMLSVKIGCFVLCHYPNVRAEAMSRSLSYCHCGNL